MMRMTRAGLKAVREARDSSEEDLPALVRERNKKWYESKREARLKASRADHESQSEVEEPSYTTIQSDKIQGVQTAVGHVNSLISEWFGDAIDRAMGRQSVTRQSLMVFVDKMRDELTAATESLTKRDVGRDICMKAELDIREARDEDGFKLSVGRYTGKANQDKNQDRRVRRFNQAGHISKGFKESSAGRYVKCDTLPVGMPEGLKAAELDIGEVRDEDGFKVKVPIHGPDPITYFMESDFGDYEEKVEARDKEARDKEARDKEARDKEARDRADGVRRKARVLRRKKAERDKLRESKGILYKLIADWFDATKAEKKGDVPVTAATEAVRENLRAVTESVTTPSVMGIPTEAKRSEAKRSEAKRSDEEAKPTKYTAAGTLAYPFMPKEISDRILKWYEAGKSRAAVGSMRVRSEFKDSRGSVYAIYAIEDHDGIVPGTEFILPM